MAPGRAGAPTQTFVDQEYVISRSFVERKEDLDAAPQPEKRAQSWPPVERTAAYTTPPVEARTPKEAKPEAETPTSRPTTLMIRNLPIRSSAEQIFAHLDHLGFNGAYDYVYIPVNPRSRMHSGYFFANFRNADLAARKNAPLRVFGRCETRVECAFFLGEWLILGVL